MEIPTKKALVNMARFVSLAFLISFILAVCTSCNSGGNSGGTPPPAGMAVAAQTSVTYAQKGQDKSVTWHMTVMGKGYSPNTQVTIKSGNVPLPGGDHYSGSSLTATIGPYSFGTATTDSKGNFTFSAPPPNGWFTNDNTVWNTDVHITAEQNNTGWFQAAEVNGGIFYNCLGGNDQSSTFSLTVAFPAWQPGQSYGCPSLPPTSGGSSGGGLGGCSSAGAAGCACKAGGACNSGLVCVYGSTCIACGGYGRPCCSGNSCSQGYSCQMSSAQGNAYSCF